MILRALLVSSLILGFLGTVNAADDDDRSIKLGGGILTMTAPKTWVRKQPKVRIIDHEFAAPGKEKDAPTARVTIMGAGGSLEANINRWKGQFRMDSANPPKVEHHKFSTHEVHMVDLTGKYFDQFGNRKWNDDYRMLGAIIVTKKHGRYYVKLIGPRETVQANEDALKRTVDSLKLH